MTALLSVYMYMEYGPNMLCYAIVTSVSWCEEAKYTFLSVEAPWPLIFSV